MNRGKELAAYVAGYGVRAFDWHRANCCHFAAGWVERIEARRPMEGLPGTPSHRAARRQVLRLGGLVSAVSARLARQPIEPKLAQVGDVVRIPLPDGEALGICDGRVALFVQLDGTFVGVPMAEASHAWRLAC